MSILFIIVRILNVLLLLSVLLPLIRNDHWTFRVFEFPRLQKFTISLILLLSTVAVLINDKNPYDWAFIFLLTITFFYLVSHIYPFTILAKKQVNNATSVDESASISVLINNVYQYNRQFDKLVQLVKDTEPDLVMLVETDQDWRMAAVQGFGEDYPYQVLHDLDNTYGMLLFSKFSLENAEVKHLIKEGIPSIETDIVLKNGRKVKFYGIHPEPPVPSENPYATDRDAEILLVAKKIKNEKQPVLVAGDLNDVAWSYTTELFLKISGMLDPRRGRGFFNTFHAKHKLLRWPLDHLFCSKHFCLEKIKRLQPTGSDHFPMYISLQLSPGKNEGKTLESDEEEEKLADEKIRAAL